MRCLYLFYSHVLISNYIFFFTGSSFCCRGSHAFLWRAASYSSARVPAACGCSTFCVYCTAGGSSLSSPVAASAPVGVVPGTTAHGWECGASSVGAGKTPAGCVASSSGAGRTLAGFSITTIIAFLFFFQCIMIDEMCIYRVQLCRELSAQFPRDAVSDVFVK